MLYKSLQHTILEYEKRKKETQSLGDRKVFKWKVFALSLCILVIILIGVLSQLIQNDLQDETDRHNMTFLPMLLQQSQELQAISSIKNLVYGMEKSQRLTFNVAERISITSQVDIGALLEGIEKKKNILFLFNLKHTISQEEEQVYRFGMLLKQQYDSEIDPDDNGAIEIFDPADDQTSVYFNLNQPQAMETSLSSGCKLYSFNKTTSDLLIMETLQFRHKANANTMDTSNTQYVEFGIFNSKCFGSNDTQAVSQVKKLTGVQLSNVKETLVLDVQSVEVFYLSFNEEV